LCCGCACQPSDRSDDAVGEGLATTSSAGDETARDGGPGEAAHDPRDLTTELSQIAHRRSLETLACPLDMMEAARC
jgi:hypothetical protein